MDLALKILVGLIALLLLLMGFNLMFAPESAVAGFGITPDGVQGLNTIRGDLGGMFIASTVLLGLGLWKGQPQWYLAVAITMGAIAFGRGVGFALDSGPATADLTPFIAELIIVAILVLASRRLMMPE